MELSRLKQQTEEGERFHEDSEILIKETPSFVWIDSFVSLSGSVMYNRKDDREPGDIDLVVKAEDDGERFLVPLDPALRLKIDRIIKERLGIDKETEWIGSPQGPNWKNQPLWDLILTPHEPEIRNVNEPEFEREFYKTDQGSPGRDGEEKIQKYIHIFKKSDSEDERIVCGVVYAPNETDAHGDEADPEEIKKAAYNFMESAQRFKFNHGGNRVAARVLENYIAPVDFQIGNQRIRKGSWVLTVRVEDTEIWESIKSGEITGWSMGGSAVVPA